MTSDNPTVKKAFKNLMIVAALVESENESKIGPLRNLVENVKSLNSRMSAIEISRSTVGPGPVGSTPYPSVWTTKLPAASPYHGTYALGGNCGSTNNSNISGTVSNYSFNKLFDTLDSKN